MLVHLDFRQLGVGILDTRICLQSEPVCVQILEVQILDIYCIHVRTMNARKLNVQERKNAEIWTQASTIQVKKLGCF